MDLSKLQRTILVLGLKDDDGYVRPRDVRSGYYGFPLRPKGRKLFFDKAEIGLDRYNSSGVAIARCFDRLARRGLARRIFNIGIRLTPEGLAVAKRIEEEESRSD